MTYTTRDDYWTDTQWGVSLVAEKRQSGTPYSYWISADYDGYDGDYEGHRLAAMAGVRMALGGAPGMTLQEHDRYLPWDNVSSLPIFWD